MTIPRYTVWYQVPTHLRTRTQLASLDLPRVPDGPVRAEIYARGGDGPKGTFDLFDLNESQPSPATANALAAAQRRRDPVAHQCQDCGAHTEALTTALYPPPQPGTDPLHLCW